MPIHLTYEDRRFLHSFNAYRMLTATRTVVPDILIGIDYFWNIFTADHPQTLSKKSIPFLVSTISTLSALPTIPIHQSTTKKMPAFYNVSRIPYKKKMDTSTCDFHGRPRILARLQPILLISDVGKAFLQIQLQISRRNATRSLWLEDPELPPPDTASPLLLAASILYYLRREPQIPLKKEIENNTYVDNVVLGAFTAKEAIRKYRESKVFFASMHVHSRSFLSNSAKVNNAISIAERSPRSTTVSLLGIQWNPDNDTFLVPMKKTTRKTVTTKRSALRALASTLVP
ncbi:hypothetical protein GCK32_001203 [Trichostrongylus colubriformis]|uniref:Uncharacterized protein n=1 Tax=Trichostrongylus colubriformis TaxID=6319 RepID=A0AAN8FCE0_TRICO